MRAALLAIVGAALATSAASAQVTIVNNLPGSWIEINQTGTALNLSDDGAADIATTVSNALFAPGTARVGSNGAVRFGGTGTSLAFSNAAIPASGNFSLTSQVLDPFWDDFNTSSGTNGNIYWQDVGGTLVVEWDHAAFFASSDTATFQIQVPSTGPIFAQFIYRDVTSARANSGASATIGYQAGGIQNDVQWSFNTAGNVGNGTILSLVAVPAPGAAALMGIGGLVAIRRRR
jgi:MYXO-CTERM domain-containing protein